MIICFISILTVADRFVPKDSRIADAFHDLPHLPLPAIMMCLPYKSPLSIISFLQYIVNRSVVNFLLDIDEE